MSIHQAREISKGTGWSFALWQSCSRFLTASAVLGGWTFGQDSGITLWCSMGHAAVPEYPGVILRLNLSGQAIGMATSPQFVPIPDVTFCMLELFLRLSRELQDLTDSDCLFLEWKSFHTKKCHIITNALQYFICTKYAVLIRRQNTNFYWVGCIHHFPWLQQSLRSCRCSTAGQGKLGRIFCDRLWCTEITSCLSEFVGHSGGMSGQQSSLDVAF